MTVLIVLTLVVTVAVILFPAAFVWYLNIGGIYAAVKKARERIGTLPKVGAN